MSYSFDGVHLIYQYFTVKSDYIDQQRASQRQREYDECLYRNLQHQYVQNVHILLEHEKDRNQLEEFFSRFQLTQAQKSKIKTTMLDRRMKYSDAFQYSNQHLTRKLCVVLNGDLFLGEGVDAVVSKARGIFEADPPTVFSLTRHENGVCQHQNNTTISDEQANNSYCGCPFMKRGYAGSHDSFWFLAPISIDVIEQTRHFQNRWGAEHSVINALLKSGYRVLNPSRSIRTYHVHASDIHPWREEPGGNKVLADPRDHIPLPPTIL